MPLENLREFLAFYLLLKLSLSFVCVLFHSFLISSFPCSHFPSWVSYSNALSSFMSFLYSFPCSLLQLLPFCSCTPYTIPLQLVQTICDLHEPSVMNSDPLPHAQSFCNFPGPLLELRIKVCYNFVDSWRLLYNFLIWQNFPCPLNVLNKPDLSRCFLSFVRKRINTWDISGALWNTPKS